MTTPHSRQGELANHFVGVLIGPRGMHGLMASPRSDLIDTSEQIVLALSRFGRFCLHDR
ncbi:MAG TPA: hypothetical protein VFE92_11405 [Dermatophilaceae bacterium]|nr:hypothetical protein [Dermatophilaceae bacterium]